jgi:exopolyphosphatase / guanosine-5'-triphosphate,3'-diphosphate pyrophosphatase
MNAPMRVAVLDLGTNTTRLLVADVEDGTVEDVVRRVDITRLGEGVDARGRLLPAPIARVRNSLTEFRRELETLGAERVLAVATSAIRDAENGEAFLGEVEWSYGFTTRLLSGKDEALLTFRGATQGRRLERPTLVVDLGGGSTELIVGDRDVVHFHTSLDIGSVRLTERFLRSDPPKTDELEECARAVRSLLSERLPAEMRADAAIGVAGTVTTLAALAQNLAEYDPARVHGFQLSAEAVAVQLARLATLPLNYRQDVPALERERAPVIVAGAVILKEVLAHFGLAEIEASERDLLHGAALEAAKLPEPVEGDAPPGAYTCC